MKRGFTWMKERGKSALTQGMPRISSRGALPNNFVLLLTNPRSGSTWLFDALRCHPGIYMNPSAVVFRTLQLSGRRYPRDLSNASDHGVSVEVKAGKWEYIPNFDETIVASNHELVEIDRKFAVEKFHPHFYDHKVNKLLKKTAKLERTANVRFIYQVRDPKSSLGSFLKYQERNPSWNAHRRPEDVPQHLRTIYETILSTATRRHGLVIDYSDLMNDFHRSMHQIFDYLWPHPSDDVKEEYRSLADQIQEVTAREKRVSQKTPFLADNKRSERSVEHRVSWLSDTYGHEMDRCYEAYHALLQLRAEGHSWDSD